MKKIFLVLVILCALFILILEILFKGLSSKNSKLGDKEVWIHRGGNPHNSLKGIGTLIIDGALGVEIDVEYQDGSLVLGHEGDVEFGKTNLKEVLQEVDDRKMKYWLDLKNLSGDNVEQIVTILNEFDLKYQIKDRILVESKNPVPLGRISNEGYHSLFWINPFERSRLHFFRNIVNKYYFIKYDFIGVSMNYEFYNERVENTYKHLDLYTYTINNEDDFQRILHKKNVKIILRDLDDKN